MIINYLNSGGAGGNQAAGEGESDASLFISRDQVVPAVLADNVSLTSDHLVQPTTGVRRSSDSSSNPPSASLREPTGLSSDSLVLKSDGVFANWDRDDRLQSDPITDDLAAAVAEVWASELGGHKRLA